MSIYSMTFRDLAASSEGLVKASPWFSENGLDGIPDKTLEELFGPTAGVNALAFGQLSQFMRAGYPVLSDLYTKEEISADPSLERTKLFFMPGAVNAPCVFICPGGAYQACCVWGEGIPVAAQFSALGYNAFVLCYRVHEDGLLPKPMDDLSRAVQLVNSQASLFQVNAKRYSVCGFSAGGHLAAEWGTENHGYLHYNLPKPELLMLLYPALSTDDFIEDIEKNVGTLNYRTVGNIYLDAIGGKQRTKESLQEYSVEHHVTDHYPPVYLMHSKDDPAVHFTTALRMKESLEMQKISFQFHPLESCGHGFSLGIGTEARDWITEAAAYWQELVPDQRRS